MQIIVKAISGQFITLTAAPTTTIGGLKAMIGFKERIPVVHQRLFYARAELDDDDRTLSSHNIQNAASLTLLIDLRGGGGAV
eukprot:16445274-Heterocapsa_arctica.AAC.1